ncbi:paraquat-inducible protein A, partial [Rhizobiaceae sp. 2RAB30]
MRRLLPFVLYAATISFALGIILPLIRVERFFLFTDEPSLAAMVYGLWTGGDLLLAATVGLFSIAFPALKLGLLHVAAYHGPDGHRLLPGWLKTLSRWSMLDVVLVALVIFAAKTSG